MDVSNVNIIRCNLNRLNCFNPMVYKVCQIMCQKCVSPYIYIYICWCGVFGQPIRTKSPLVWEPSLAELSIFGGGVFLSHMEVPSDKRFQLPFLATKQEMVTEN